MICSFGGCGGDGQTISTKRQLITLLRLHETVRLELLQTYLSSRYQAASAHVVNSAGTFSDQIDIVVFDRPCWSFNLKFRGETVIQA